MVQELAPRTGDIDYVDTIPRAKRWAERLRIFSAGSEGALVLRSLGIERTALRDCHPPNAYQMGNHQRTQTSATLLAAHTGVKTQLPPQIRQWLTMYRKQMGPKGKSPMIKLAPLTINRPSACLTVRLIRNCTLSALLFEELLLELPADFLVAHGLTPREAEVLRWIAQGKSSLEIARILNISDRTVSKHLERVYLRLGVENRHAAIALVHDELRRNASGR